MKNIVIKWAVFLTAFLISLEVSAQNVRVSGVVTDALGPIPGANIMEEGTTNGTVTDVNGKYSISVSAKSTLVFSCIGYKEQKIRVGTKTVLNVDMVEESKMLDELVVVGYGVQRKSDVATSVASVKADEMKTFPAGNVADMLRGRAAGVNVTSSSGRPGSTPSITIRGSRSISADNAPLYIIDGSPSSATEFSTLSADDIESVEILKDAASQAIYGARASDGVVLVTTKRGKAGKVEVSYNGYLGIQSLWRNFDFYSPEEYMQLRREAKAHDKGIVDAREISIAEALEDEVMQRVWASGKFIDWEKEMFRNAIYHNYDVSVRGGTEKIKVSAGANYFDQQGMVVTGSGYQKFSLRLNLDFEISKWISFGINSSYAMTKQDREDGNFNDFITSSPLAEIYDVDGKYTKYINSEGNYNPLYRAQHYGREVSRDNYRLNFFMDVKPFKGFNYRLNTSVYNQTSEDGSYKDSQYPGGGGTAVLDESRTQNWLVENIVTYKVPIRNKKHQLTLTGVQSVDHNGSKSIGYSVENLPVDKDWNFISQGEFTGKPRRQFNENNLVSFMARAQYSLLDRYLLNVAVRRDGSSRFGKENKWGTFPSAAFAWRVNQENFLKDVSWIDNLKLRVSYGIVGNQNGIGNYTTLGLADNKGYEFGDTFQMGYLPGKELSNPNLKWETTAITDIGLDFGVLNNRINFTADYYYKKTTDLLWNISVPLTTGFGTVLKNIGSLENKGLELSVSADVLTGQFKWNTMINWSTNKNKVLEIPGYIPTQQGTISGHLKVNGSWLEPGLPVGVWNLLKTNGVMRTEKEWQDAARVADSNFDKIGDMSFVDKNGDGKISFGEDRQIVGDPNPDFIFGWTNNFSYKNFDLSIYINGSVGNDIYNVLRAETNIVSTWGNQRAEVMDRWTANNPNGKYPRAHVLVNQNLLQSDFLIEDGSFLRVQNVTLGYTFPKVPFLRSLRVYATAQNLLTITGYSGFNPEVNSQGQSNLQMGVDYNAYPTARSFILGVNIGF